MVQVSHVPPLPHHLKEGEDVQLLEVDQQAYAPKEEFLFANGATMMYKSTACWGYKLSHIKVRGPCCHFLTCVLHWGQNSTKGREHVL